MTSMNGMNSLKISKAAIRNGCNSEADNDSETDVGKRDLIRKKKKIQFPPLLTLKIVMNR